MIPRLLVWREGETVTSSMKMEKFFVFDMVHLVPERTFVSSIFYQFKKDRIWKGGTGKIEAILETSYCSLNSMISQSNPIYICIAHFKNKLFKVVHKIFELIFLEC